MRIIAIGGEPGAGKTALMNKVLSFYGIDNPSCEDYHSVKFVPYLIKDNVIVLGKYERGEVFGGTDKMSMAVQPHVIEFLNILEQGNPNAVVLFEGDRLFNSSFLEYCVSKYDTKIIYLKTNKSIREERFAERGSNQNKTWLQGRETKIANILTNFNLMFEITSIKNDTYQEQSEALLEVIKLVG